MLQNLVLFQHRPDMLTSAIGRLPWSTGLALLGVGHGNLKNVELDSFRVAMKMVRLANQGSRIQTAWAIGLRLVSLAAQEYGGKNLPSSYYGAAVSLCSTDRWLSALAVLRFAEKSNQASAPLALEAARVCANPVSWKTSLRLMMHCERYLAQLSLQTSAEVNRIEDGNRIGVDLLLYGAPTNPTDEEREREKEWRRCVETIHSVTANLPWRLALELVERFGEDSPLHRALSISVGSASRQVIQASLPTVPWKVALSLVQPSSIVKALPHIIPRIPSFRIARQLLDDAIGPNAMLKVTDSTRAALSRLALNELRRINRDRSMQVVGAPSPVGPGLPAPLPAPEVEVTAVDSGNRGQSQWIEALQLTLSYFTSPTNSIAPVLGGVTSALEAANVAEEAGAAGTLMTFLADRSMYQEIVALSGILAARGQALDEGSLQIILGSNLELLHEGNRPSSESTRLPQSPRWDVVLSQCQQLLGGRFNQRHWDVKAKLSPKTVSKLIHVAFLQNCPLGALEIIRMAESQGVVLSRRKEIEALVYCAEYQRPTEAVAILDHLLRTREATGDELGDALPLVPLVWTIAKHHGRQSDVIRCVKRRFPRFAQ
jgi:hypothetical protein